MSKEDILEIITDFANAMEAAAVSMKQQVANIVEVKVKTELSEEPYDRLLWTNGQGARGPYQMASAKNNSNSDLYRHLEAILKKNSGRFSDKSWKHYYWLRQEGDAIFRREKTRFQQTITAREE